MLDQVIASGYAGIWAVLMRLVIQVLARFFVAGERLMRFRVGADSVVSMC